MESVASRAQAQRRVERIRIFREELDRILAEGVLELAPEQKQRLDDHLAGTLGELATRFDVDTTESQKRFSWGVRIASTITGFALCAAFVLYLYRVWGILPLAVQVGIIVAAPLAAIAGMEYCHNRARSYWTAILGVLAFALAVLNLNALGAMFNLTGSPYAFLVWAVFGIALAYGYRVKLLLAAGLVCAVAFADMLVLKAAGLYWADGFRVEGIVLAGAAVMIVPSVLKHRRLEDFPWTYEIIGLVAILLAMFFGSLNGILSFLPFAGRTVEIGYQLLGLFAGAAAMWIGVIRRKPAVFNIGAAAFALFLYIRLYQWWWDWMPKYAFFLSVGLLSLGFLYGLQHIRKRRTA